MQKNLNIFITSIYIKYYIKIEINYFYRMDLTSITILQGNGNHFATLEILMNNCRRIIECSFFIKYLINLFILLFNINIKLQMDYIRPRNM